MLGAYEIDAIHDALINQHDLRSSDRRIMAYPRDGSPPYDFETAYKVYADNILLSGLTSKTGIELNGKYGKVVGMDGLMKNPATGMSIGIHRSIKEDEFRLYVQLDHDLNRVVKVKVQNIRLIPVNVPAMTPELSDEQVMSHLQWLVSDGPQNSRIRPKGGRLDIDQRMALAESWVDNGAFPDAFSFRCCDASVGGVLDTNECPLLKMLMSSTGACYGSGFVDFRRLNIGLAGNGTETCVMCLDVLSTREPVSLLPCGHQLHFLCCSRYDAFVRESGRQISCPICRSEVLGHANTNLSHHSMAPEQRLRNRFAEVMQSGFCVECQIRFIEFSQVSEVEVDTPEGPGLQTYIGGVPTKCVRLESR